MTNECSMAAVRRQSPILRRTGHATTMNIDRFRVRQAIERC